MTALDTPILEFRNLCRSFFGVQVVKNVTFSLNRGHVLALIGENGAGKSTLMNILGGVLKPDSGSMTLDGRPYAPRDSREADRLGVAFIHQELNLFANLSIAENLHIPEFPHRRLGPLPLPFVNRRAMRRRAKQLLAAVDLQKSPDALVENLSPGERQLVEIAKAIGADAKLIILDEPTTSLTAHEAERLFALMEKLRAQGVSMIYISHRLEEVLRLCDDIVVLRDGQLVGGGPRRDFTAEKMISLMVGRDIAQLFPPRSTQPTEQLILEVDRLTRRGVIQDVTFSLQRGEVLGISGLMGAGRTELARLLFGLDPLHAGRITLNGQAHRPSPRQSIRNGMAFLTENRREEGLMLDASIADNAALVALPSYAGPAIRWIRQKQLKQRIDDVVASMRLAGSAIDRQAVKTLSGGNQQKVVLSKWLLESPSVLILDEPTRGIDVGAKHEIYKLINDLAASGAGVLFISSEIEELIGMCDRILVMSGGQIRAAFHRAQFDREQILKAALEAV